MDETVDTFEHVNDDKPDPELEEHDGKVHVGDDEIIGLADAVNTSVSEKLTWLPLGVLNFCRLKIPKRKLSCAERTTFRSPDSGQGTENLQDGSKLKLNALDYNVDRINDTEDTFDVNSKYHQNKYW